jgi:hypothetical protein
MCCGDMAAANPHSGVPPICRPCGYALGTQPHRPIARARKADGRVLKLIATPPANTSPAAVVAR